MAKKTQASDDGTADGSPDGANGAGSAGAASRNAQFAGAVKDSASQIWLAGLAAFAKAQQEGGKVFEALVKEGQSLQRKTQSVAEETLSETTARMAGMASDMSSRASGHWGKLESLFEERVALALGKLGVPSKRDIEALKARIDDLERTAERLRASQRKPAKAAKTTTAGNGATRPSARKRPVRKTAA